MKHTIEFDDVDDRHDLLEAVHARDAWRFIWEFEQHLRGLWKYGESDKVSIEELWQRWHDDKPQVEGIE